MATGPPDTRSVISWKKAPQCGAGVSLSIIELASSVSPTPLFVGPAHPTGRPVSQVPVCGGLASAPSCYNCRPSSHDLFAGLTVARCLWSLALHDPCVGSADRGRTRYSFSLGDRGLPVPGRVYEIREPRGLRLSSGDLGVQDSNYFEFTDTMVGSVNEYSSTYPPPFVFDGVSVSPTTRVRLYFTPSTSPCAFASASESHAA